MVRDLVDSGRLSQRTREEVLRLLGQPSYESAQPGCGYLDYVVKYATLDEFSFNSVYILTVSLDGKNRVFKVWIKAD